jgi:hypothetical protein
MIGVLMLSSCLGFSLVVLCMWAASYGELRRERRMRRLKRAVRAAVRGLEHRTARPKQLHLERRRKDGLTYVEQHADPAIVASLLRREGTL